MIQCKHNFLLFTWLFCYIYSIQKSHNLPIIQLSLLPSLPLTAHEESNGWHRGGGSQASLPPGGPCPFLVSLIKSPFVGNGSVLELCLLPTPISKQGPWVGSSGSKKGTRGQTRSTGTLPHPSFSVCIHGSLSSPAFSEHIPCRRPRARAEDPHPRGGCVWLSVLPALRWAVSSGGASCLDPGISLG